MRQRVLVSPAPGKAVKFLFWHSEGLGRSPALAAAVGEFLRHAEAQPQQPLPAWLRAHAPLDEAAAEELLEEAELAELLDPEAIAEVEAILQRLDPKHQASDANSLHDLLRMLGDLTTEEIALRCRPASENQEGLQHWLEELATLRWAVQLRVAGELRWIAAEDAGLYRDVLGVPHPAGLPAEFVAPVIDALSRLLRRWIRRPGPFATEQPAMHFGLTSAQVGPLLRLVEGDGQLLRGRIRPGAWVDEWADTEVLKRPKRASLARLRHRTAPQEAAALGRFLADWQGLDYPLHDTAASSAAGTAQRTTHARSERELGAIWTRHTLDRVLAALLPLEGLALPWSSLSLSLLPMRLPGFTPELLAHLAASGILVWIGVAPIGLRDGKVMLLRCEQAARLLRQMITRRRPPSMPAFSSSSLRGGPPSSPSWNARCVTPCLRPACRSWRPHCGMSSGAVKSPTTALPPCAKRCRVSAGAAADLHA